MEQLKVLRKMKIQEKRSHPFINVGTSVFIRVEQLRKLGLKVAIEVVNQKREDLGLPRYPTAY